MEKKISVLGGGTWGCTIANLLAEKGHKVTVWDFSEDVINSLNKTRVPLKLPFLRIVEGVKFSSDLSETVKNSSEIFVIVPSHAVRSVLTKAKRSIKKDTVIAMFSKGLEDKNGLTLSQVSEEALGASVKNTYCVISGPSHAEEVCQHKPTTVVAASFVPEISKRCQDLLMSPYFRVYTQEDVRGVEIGGALKNVIAIAAGICDGLSFGDNTKAALLTRGLAEISRFGVALGAKMETFSGLAGMGDLIVTATSRFSRNRNFGELIALHRTVENALSEIGMVVEGVKTTYSASHLAIRNQIPMPITQEVYKIIFEGKSPVDAVSSLMGRSPKPEIY